MARYTVKRLLVTVPVLFAVSLLVFVLVAQAGDPLADLRGRVDVTQRDIDARRSQLHLDDPVIVRYGRWISAAVRGDLGASNSGRDVASLLGERMQVTMRMVAAAFALALIGAVVVAGTGSARRYSAVDHALTVGSFGLLAVPVFWLGTLLKEAAIRFNDAVEPLVGRSLVFTSGAQSPILPGGLMDRWLDYLGHLVLPTVALSLLLVASWSRYLRASMLETLEGDHVRAARARGVSEHGVVLRHGLRPSLVPFTSIAAVDLAQLIGGAVVVEQVFGWNGMGQLLVRGVSQSDTNVVLAWLMATAIVVVAFNLVADLLAARLDPRIRLG